MSFLKTSGLLFFGVLLLSAVSADDGIKKSEVDALVAPLLANDELVGLVIGVTHNGKQSIFAYGSISPTRSEAPNGETIFEIGSITKTFTGLLLARLVQEGSVKLDDPISKFLPAGIDTPRWGQEEIRLIDLATHTSGLPKVPTNLNAQDVSNLYADYSSEQLLQYLRAEARGNVGRSFFSAFTAAKQPTHKYSNLGVGLLGHLLARSAEKPYEQLLIEKVCQPLGLEDTCIHLNQEQESRFAPGHNSRGKPVPSWDFGCLAPCGGLRTSCKDMLKYLSILVEPGQHELATAVNLTLQPRRPINSDRSVGLCWEIENDAEVAHHGGSTGGFHSFIMLRQKSNVGVIVMANCRNKIIEHLAPRMLHLAVGAPVEPIPIRKPIKLETDFLRACAGNYRYSDSSTAEVVQVDDGLIVRPNDAPEHQLYPESKTEFFTKLSPQIRFTFEVREDGAVDEMIYQDGTVGLTMKYRRVPSP